MKLDNSTESDEIDLSQLLHTIWVSRKVIALIAAVLGLAGFTVGQISTRFVSEGVVQTDQINANQINANNANNANSFSFNANNANNAKISAANYKRYEIILLTAPNLEKFLANKVSPNPDVAIFLEGLAKSPVSLKEAIKPEFAFTDKDQKSLGVKSASNDAGAMIGVRIRFESDSPTQGAPVVALGDYVRDTILRVDMEAMVFEKCLQNQTMDQSMRIEKIRNDFKITQEESRAQTLRSLRSTDKPDARQVVSLDNGGTRYLSLQAQLNAVEIHISEIKLAQSNRDNEVKLSELRKAYYCGAKSALEKKINTSEVIVEMQKTQDSVLKI